MLTKRLGISGYLVAAAMLSGSLIASPAFAQKAFHIEQRWPIGGEGGWDYLSVDSASHRLYLAHETKVDVVDTNTGKVVGEVTGLKRCHGVVLSPDGKTGFVSDGGANAVVMFDPQTFAKTGQIATGTNPDGLLVEPATKTVWAFNGGSNNATVIDIAGRKAIGTLALPGRPEFPAADGSGILFVNLEDKHAIARVDAKTMKVTANWPLTACESPSGLALDTTGGRLFSVCDGKKMAVTDAHTGKSLGTATVGEGPDAAAYDAKNKLAFSSNGEGTLTVVDAGKPGYPVMQTLKTEKGARTMAYDEATGKAYLVTAKYGKLAAGAKRPPVLPDTFMVLVVGRE